MTGRNVGNEWRGGRTVKTSFWHNALIMLPGYYLISLKEFCIIKTSFRVEIIWGLLDLLSESFPPKKMAI